MMIFQKNLWYKNEIILQFQHRTIDSFGFDWTVGEILPIIVATYLYSVVFASRSNTPGVATKEIVHAS